MAWAIRLIRIPGRWWQYARNRRMQAEVRRWFRYLTAGPRRNRYVRHGWRVIPRVMGGQGPVTMVNTTAGAIATGTTSVAPAWQSGTRVAGDMLIAVVTAYGANNITQAAGGGTWTKVGGADAVQGSIRTAIFYRVSTGGEVAPTFASTSATRMSAQIDWFRSGTGFQATPLDVSGTRLESSAVTTTTVAASANPTVAEGLVVAVGQWYAGTARTFTPTYADANVDATTPALLDDTGTSLNQHHFAFWGQVTASGQTTSVSFTSSNRSGTWASVIAVFKPAVPTDGWRDANARFRLRSEFIWRDANVRVDVEPPTGYRNASARVRLQGQTTRDGAARFRLVSPPTHRDANVRARLVVERLRDAAVRFRLISGATWRNANALVGLVSPETWRNAAVRFRLSLTPYWIDAAVRFGLEGRSFRDAANRFKLVSGGAGTVAYRTATVEGTPGGALGTTGNASPATCAAPAGRVTDDVLLVHVQHSSQTATLTPPGGWTLIETSTTGYHRAWVLARIATGTSADDFSATITGSGQWLTDMLAYSGCDVSGAVDVTAITAHHNNNSASNTDQLWALPAITTPARDGWKIVGFWGEDAVGTQHRFSPTSSSPNIGLPVERAEVYETVQIQDFAVMDLGGGAQSTDYVLSATCDGQEGISGIVLVLQASTGGGPTTAYRNANARFRLALAPAWRDTNVRVSLLGRTIRDAVSRFKLEVPGTGAFRDAAARVAVLVRAFRDASARFKLTAPSGNGGPWTLVDHASNLASTAGITVTMPNAIQAGDLIVAWGHGNTADPPASCFQDSVNGTWPDRYALMDSMGGISSGRIALGAWLAGSAAHAAGWTVTFTGSGSRAHIVVLVYRPTTAGSYSLVGTNSGFSTTSVTPWATAATAESAETHDLGVAAVIKATGTVTNTPDSPWQARDTTTYIYSQDQLDLAAGTLVGSGDFNVGPGGWAALVAIFRASTGGGTSYRDSATRFRLAAQSFRNGAIRFVLAAGTQAFRDATARVRLAVQTNRDATTRVQVEVPVTWPITLTVGGDTRLDGTQTVRDRAMATGDAVLSTDPDAVIFVGDAVLNGDLATLRGDYNDTWGRFKSLTLPIKGNHDSVDADWGTYWTEAPLPLAGPGAAGKRWYTFDLANWHIVLLNVQQGGSNYAIGTEQYNWLSDDLTAHDGMPTIVAIHAPRYSYDGTHGDNANFADAYALLKSHKVDLIICGHVHNYQRYKPMDGAGNQDVTGPRELIVGTGGAGLYGVTSPHVNLDNSDGTVFGVAKLTLNPYSYTIDWVGSTGTFTDTLTAPTLKSTYRDAGARVRIAPSATRDANARVRIAGTAWRNANVRFSLVVAGQAWRNGQARFSLVVRAWRDANVRTALQVQAFRDRAVRVAVWVQTFRNANVRTRLVVQAFRDANARTRIVGGAWRNGTARLLLRAWGYRDAVVRVGLVVAGTGWRNGSARFRLYVQAFRNANARLSLVGQAYRNGQARFRLYVQGFRDASTRTRLWVTGFRNGTARFFVQVARDASVRVRLRVGAFRDATSRLSLIVAGQAWRNASARFSLLVQAYRNANTRAIVGVQAYRNGSARFSQRVQAWRDQATRVWLISAGVWRNASARFGLRAPSVRDQAVRFSLRVQAYRDGGTRARLWVQVWRDSNVRLLLRAWGWADAHVRFGLAVQAFRNANARVRVVGSTIRDAAVRFKLFSAGVNRDATTRVRVWVQAFRNANVRVRLRVQAFGDATARFYVGVLAYRNATARLRLVAIGFRNATARLRLRAWGWRDVVIRARVVIGIENWQFANARIYLGLAGRRDVRARFMLAEDIAVFVEGPMSGWMVEDSEDDWVVDGPESGWEVGPWI